ncbi:MULTISPECIES: phage tail protein [Enterobacteriaceae]|nr:MULTISPECIES: phage tail protein [Enterobacteriaceae]ASC13533.1 phage tail protein [Klebsiella pneumoniae]EDX5841383.1 phage tail protein [Salmonella enterica subsp. enterica]WCE47618.1 phage tail protein [Escherichia coli]
MANLPETPQWEEGIYQIEVSDPVLGGPDGISNRQGKQLASRTLYLKQQVEKGGSDLAKHIAAADPHTQYAPKASPTFTGTPTAPTPANSDNSKKLATTEFVAKALAALAGSAPETLDTLKELADALGNDPNFATTVLNKLAEKLAKDQNGADIPDPALFVKNLGLGEAAKRDVGTGDNQIPDMGAFASGSGWFRLPGGYIVQFGTFAGNTTRFISGHFPIPFPNQPMVSVSVMSDAVQSDPSNPAPQVLSVNFEHISNSAWRVATSDISQQYRFSYISIGR